MTHLLMSFSRSEDELLLHSLVVATGVGSAVFRFEVDDHRLAEVTLAADRHCKLAHVFHDGVVRRVKGNGDGVVVLLLHIILSLVLHAFDTSRPRGAASQLFRRLSTRVQYEAIILHESTAVALL